MLEECAVKIKSDQVHSKWGSMDGICFFNSLITTVIISTNKETAETEV